MDTKNQPPAKIPAVRTYAGDLELGRKIKALTPKEEKPAEVKVTPNKEETIVKEVEKEIPALVSAVPTKNISLPPATTATREVIKIAKVTPPKTTSTLPRRDTFFAENEDSAPATIITDAKHDRFKLIPAIKRSIKSWFTSKKDNYQAKKIPKYTVPETSRRKGVIQKATSITGKLATSDFSSIHERIRNRNENEKKNNPPTTWSANTEPGFLLLEEPEAPSVTNVQMVSRRSFRTVPQEIRVTEINHNRKSEVVPPREFARMAEAEVITPLTKPEIATESVPENIQVTKITSEQITERLSALEAEDAERWATETPAVAAPVEILAPEKLNTEPEVETLPDKSDQTTPETKVEIPKIISPEKPRWGSETPVAVAPVEILTPTVLPLTEPERREIPAEEVLTEQAEEEEVASPKRKNILSLNTNILTLSVSGLAIALILSIGFGYFWVTKQIKLNSEQLVTELPLLIDIPLKKLSVADNTKESFINALTTASKENSDTVQIVFLSNEPNYEPVSPSTLLLAFDIFLEQNFAQSISDIRFGIAKDKQPFVIIKATHEAAAKGGLLMWENGMYEDLVELLSIVETEPIANTKFVDASLNGIDVRVLKNKNGTERLIYGFTKDTIIITTNIFNFSELSKLVK